MLCYRSDLIEYNQLTKGNPIYNLNNAFNVAEEKLGLARLLDAEGMFIFLLSSYVKFPMY